MMCAVLIHTVLPWRVLGSVRCSEVVTLVQMAI